MLKTLTITFASLLLITVISFKSNGDNSNKKIIIIDTNAPCISTDCHATMGKKKFIHKAGIDPKRCLSCHPVIKEGEHRFKEIPADTSPLCFECHGEKSPPADVPGKPLKVQSTDKDIKLHAPFAEGKCTTCHDPHENDFYRHLKKQYPEDTYAKYTPEAYSLCVNTQCHQSFEKALTEPRTLSDTKFRNGNVNLHFKHVSITKGRTCRTCHQHHGSKYPKLITETFKFGTRVLTNSYQPTDTGGSCNTSCHRTAKYDRYTTEFNMIKTTPNPGSDATEEELALSRERDLQNDKNQNKGPELKK